jgi:hypothetical protein
VISNFFFGALRHDGVLFVLIDVDIRADGICEVGVIDLPGSGCSMLRPRVAVEGLAACEGMRLPEAHGLDVARVAAARQVTEVIAEAIGDRRRVVKRVPVVTVVSQWRAGSNSSIGLPSGSSS